MKCFFSYSRRDLDFAKRLTNDLKTYGLDVWWDPGIKPGSKWDKAVEAALDASTVFILALSTQSINSDNVLNEVDYAIDKGKTIIPLLFERCEIPLRIRRYQWIDFTKEYHSALNLLLETINESIPHREPAGTDIQSDEDWLKLARKKKRNKRVKTAIYLISPIVLLLIIWGIIVFYPVTGISLIDENEYKISYEINNGNILFNIKSSDVPTIYVDVNQNKKIDSLIDRLYGITNLSKDVLCASYFLNNFATTICGGAPTTANLKTSYNKYTFKIPVDELRNNDQSQAVSVQFSFFDPKRGFTRLYPVRNELYNFSNVYRININLHIRN